jgi:hypothetical protein
VPPGLGEILAESGDLTLRRLRRASEWRRAHGGTIDRALLATGAVSEQPLFRALERLTGLPSVSRERLAAAGREAVETLPADARRRLRALPFERRGDVLHVAVADPGNPVLETGLVAATGCAVRLYVTAGPILDDALQAAAPAWGARGAEGGDGASPGTAPGPPAPAEPPPGEGSGPSVGSDPFARLARALLADAVDEGARAIEIGPDGRGARARTWAAGAVLSSRPLPGPVLGPLIAWLVSRSRPPGPFDEGGLVLERARRRVRVEVTVGAEGAWLVLDTLPDLPPEASEICIHDGADDDVFCPACGAPL